MARLYSLFADAPVLGSLINPRSGDGDLVVAAFHELQPLLEKAFEQEAQDDTAHEMAVTARGLARAAEILASQFTLVATNVPYLGQRKQDEKLKDYCGRVHAEAKADLATCFVERSISFCAPNGTTALVTPQNWLFLSSYSALRKNLLVHHTVDVVARLGAGAFETIGGEVVNVALFVSSEARPDGRGRFLNLDVSAGATARDKAELLPSQAASKVDQSSQLKNPDCRLTGEESSSGKLLEQYTLSPQGVKTGDDAKWKRIFWEFSKNGNGWRFYQAPVDRIMAFGGREHVIDWRTDGHGMVRPRLENTAVGRVGVGISAVGQIAATIYTGEHYDSGVATIIPVNAEHLDAVWAYCSSPDFKAAVRRIDQKVAVTNMTLVKVPFDLARWQRVAAADYPRGLPRPFSSDPTQWLFNGRPEESDQPLQVAVARLLGYQWPRQTGSSFSDCPSLGPDGLEAFADADGVVPISPTKGEAAAAERLRDLLARAYGKEWSASRQQKLLAQVDSAGASLEDWLRNAFFEQHCKLFQNHPFIWHIWDGHKGGFSALANCHKLTHANLEKLTYAYLGDWIRRQQAAVDAGESGSDARLQAAKNLQATLKLILEGEPPFDLFVRWKPLSQQAIGWHPDLNDGVRINIRPFMARDIPGGKKGAGVLRAKPKVKWEKDRGKEPVRAKAEYPWFWVWDEKTLDFAGVGKEPDGNRWNDCHYSNEFKRKAKGG